MKPLQRVLFDGCIVEGAGLDGEVIDGCKTVLGSLVCSKGFWCGAQPMDGGEDGVRGEDQPRNN